MGRLRRQQGGTMDVYAVKRYIRFFSNQE